MSWGAWWTKKVPEPSRKPDQAPPKPPEVRLQWTLGIDNKYVNDVARQALTAALAKELETAAKLSVENWIYESEEGSALLMLMKAEIEKYPNVTDEMKVRMQTALSDIVMDELAPNQFGPVGKHKARGQ